MAAMPIASLRRKLRQTSAPPKRGQLNRFHAAPLLAFPRLDDLSNSARPFSRGALYELLANPIYIGEVRNMEERHIAPTTQSVGNAEQSATKKL
jgi:hypothetical protein